VSDVFVVFQRINVWHADGVFVLPYRSIVSWHQDEVQKYQIKILRWRGVVNKECYNWVDIKNYRLLFLSLKMKARTVFVSDHECADTGLIVDVGTDFVELKVFSASGEWMSETVFFQFGNIVEIRIDDYYTQVLKEYADRLT